MKNLKFRIWDKQLKQFLYKLPEQHHLDWERFDIQQFTGLLDKNGKEIYEGDIVKTNFRKIVVEWGKDYDVDGWYQWAGYDLGIYDDGYPEKDFEVIGNIYENPELLNNK